MVKYNNRLCIADDTMNDFKRCIELMVKQYPILKEVNVTHDMMQKELQKFYLKSGGF